MSVTYFLFGRSRQGWIHSLILYTFCLQRSNCYGKRKYIFRKVTVYYFTYVCVPEFFQIHLRVRIFIFYYFLYSFFCLQFLFLFFFFSLFFFLDFFFCSSCFFLPSFLFYFLLFYFVWQLFFHRPSFSYLTTFSNALSKHFYSFSCFIIPVLVYFFILSFTDFHIFIVST